MSEQITVTLPDGSAREVDAGTTPAAVAADIGPRLAKAAVAAKADGEWIDLDRKLDHDVSLAIVTPDTPDGREVLRHSTAPTAFTVVDHSARGIEIRRIARPVERVGEGNHYNAAERTGEKNSREAPSDVRAFPVFPRDNQRSGEHDHARANS